MVNRKRGYNFLGRKDILVCDKMTHSRNSEDVLDALFVLSIFLIIIGLLIYTLIPPPFGGITLIILFVLTIVAIIFRWEDAKKYFTVFVKEVKKWKRAEKEKEDKKKLINRIIAEIDDFKPAREHLGLEYNYQLNLHGWLNKTFPTAKIEKQRGSSRPDIVIDDIAIEIKGPTKSRDLTTIADKCMRYGKKFPDGIIIALFEADHVNNRLYKEWVEAMKEQYSQVKVIRKN